MECVTAGEAVRFACTARRNKSLSSSGRLLVFGFVFAVCMGIALAFAVLLGAWMILPFAGAEMLVLYLAFRHVGRHAADYERIAMEGDSLAIEVRDGGHVRRFSLNRQWAQVVCAGDGSRLALRSHGRELEIGRHMNGEQRFVLGSALKRELKRELRSIG